MVFNSPYYAIVGLIVIISYLLWYFQVSKKREFYLPAKSFRRNINLPRWIRFVLGVFGISLISFALMQPRIPQGFAKNKIKVNDIFIVVDVSVSMLAVDFKPNRIEKAKEKIREFIKLRPTDRIGIVMFSEKAFTLLPLSTDLELIEQIIEEIKVGFLGQGTNIGDALGLAVGRSTQSIAENKVVVLLTDGVSNVGSMTPIQAAEQAREKGVKVYTIGIGQKSNGNLLSNGGGGLRRIPGGSVDLDTLDKIAKITGGKSFYAQDGNALGDVLSEIQKLEKTEIETSAKVIYKELYWEYLFLGVLMLFLSEWIGFFILREAL